MGHYERFAPEAVSPSEEHQRLSDSVLMSRFRKGGEGSEACMTKLVSRYTQRALRVARFLTGRQASAEDAVQEAFLRVVRHRSRFTEGEPFAPWFWAVLRNACTDQLRERHRARRIAEAREEACRSFPEVGSDDLEGLEALQPYLQLVPETDRALLELRFGYGLSLADIAEALGCREEAAKKRAQRALARLQKQLGQ